MSPPGGDPSENKEAAYQATEGSTEKTAAEGRGQPGD